MKIEHIDANTVIVHTGTNRTLVNHGKNIVMLTEQGDVLLDRIYYKWSSTTSKKRNDFLRTTSKETESRIKSGVYRLVDLNCDTGE